jgi:hypothetical protein
MHNIQEMDGMHCPGPGRMHKIQKMAGYTVPAWVVLANDTVYQLQQFARVPGLVAQYTGNGWDALPGSGSDAQNTENGGIHCRSGWFWRTIQCISCNSSPGCPGQSHNIQEMDGMHCPDLGQTNRIQKMAGYTVPVWHCVLVGWDTVPRLWYQMYQLQQVTQHSDMRLILFPSTILINQISLGVGLRLFVY